MTKSSILLPLIGAAAGLLCCFSCVPVNTELGQDFLAVNQQYDLHVENFPLTDIRMDVPDGLSTYSLYRFTFGAVKDDFFGTTTRSTAFSLVPVQDTLDLGTNTRVKSFTFTGIPDSVSCVVKTQQHILQNVHVYPLKKRMDFKKARPELDIDRSARITQGIPVYNGADTLEFAFTQAWAEKFVSDYKKLGADIVFFPYTKSQSSTRIRAAMKDGGQ